MHILPVYPVTDMGSYKSGELNAFENNYINDRVEYRKFPEGVTLRRIFEKHSKVPHMRKKTDMKQVITKNRIFWLLIVIRLQQMSTGHTVRKMRRVVNRNFRRNNMGNISVMPINEA